MNQTNPVPPPPKPLLNIAFNILIPVLILNQLGKRLHENGPLISLLVALAFPIGYGLWDYLVRKHKNYVSLLGLVSILFTGGIALFKLDGFWFTVKDAAFPALIGMAVAASAFSKRPLVETLFCNDQLMNLSLVQAAIAQNQRIHEFSQLVKTATLWMSSSFFLSSLLNFILARRIFTPIESGLSDVVHSQILNEQIARMTGYGFVVIALPSMILTGLVLYRFLLRLSQLSGMKLEEIMKS